MTRGPYFLDREAYIELDEEQAGEVFCCGRGGWIKAGEEEPWESRKEIKDEGNAQFQMRRGIHQVLRLQENGMRRSLMAADSFFKVRVQSVYHMLPLVSKPKTTSEFDADETSVCFRLRYASRATNTSGNT